MDTLGPNLTDDGSCCANCGYSKPCHIGRDNVYCWCPGRVGYKNRGGVCPEHKAKNTEMEVKP